MAKKPFILPKEFTPGFSTKSKPTADIEIDYSNTIAQKLTHAFVAFSDGYRNLVDNAKSTLPTGVSVDVVAEGHTIDATGSESSPVVLDAAYTPSLNGISVFSNCYFYNSTQDHTVFDKSIRDLLIWADTNAGTLRLGVYSGSGAFSADNSIPINEWVTIGVSTTTNNSNDTANGYINGTKVINNGSINDVKAVEDTIVSITSGDGTKPTNGRQQFIFLFDGILSDAEFKSLNDDPYQILKPSIQSIAYLGAAAGGTNTYNHTSTGGINTSGTSTVSTKKDFVSSGGISTSGSADTALIPEGVVYNHIATGGIVTGGEFSVSTIKSVTGFGGIITGGSADTALVQAGTNIYNHTSTGGITTSGSADVNQLKGIVSTGGIDIAGESGISSIKSITGSGGIVIDGVADTGLVQAGTNIYNHISMGGISTGGSAEIIQINDYQASGGFVISGNAITSSSAIIDIVVAQSKTFTLRAKEKNINLRQKYKTISLRA